MIAWGVNKFYARPACVLGLSEDDYLIHVAQIIQLERFLV